MGDDFEHGAPEELDAGDDVLLGLAVLLGFASVLYLLCVACAKVAHCSLKLVAVSLFLGGGAGLFGLTSPSALPEPSSSAGPLGNRSTSNSNPHRSHETSNYRTAPPASSSEEWTSSARGFAASVGSVAKGELARRFSGNASESEGGTPFESAEKKRSKP